MRQRSFHGHREDNFPLEPDIQTDQPSFDCQIHDFLSKNSEIFTPISGRVLTWGRGLPCRRGSPCETYRRCGPTCGQSIMLRHLRPQPMLQLTSSDQWLPRHDAHSAITLAYSSLVLTQWCLLCNDASLPLTGAYSPVLTLQ